jgi:hypothetical protein
MKKVDLRKRKTRGGRTAISQEDFTLSEEMDRISTHGTHNQLIVLFEFLDADVPHVSSGISLLSFCVYVDYH